MKLIKRTYLTTFTWLIPVLLIGSIFSFYMIKYIVYEETDEYLTYEMERLVAYHSNYGDLPDYHKVTDVIEELKFDKPVFKDTLILEQRDNEMIPHRELYFSINHEGKDFSIVLRQILPGNDDIIEGALLMMLGLFLLISFFLFLMVNLISHKLWNPFYKTLDILSKYKITEPIPFFSTSGIDEFNTLNSTIEELLKKITDDFKRTKEFNENASHELQTHLTIIRLNAEKLLNNFQDDGKSLADLQAIHHAAAKLATAQKSLLLLSKIGNLEFNNNTTLNLSEIVSNSLFLFQEAIEMRSITLNKSMENCKLHIDAGLADILVNNLLKNAVKHNTENGYISITLTQKYLMIENSGVPFQEDPRTLFERFTTGKTGNLGLGLAIVKQICDVYRYHLSYAVDGNEHKIQVLFTKG